MYTQPLHLWDRASGNLTDFNTHFSFVISSNMTRYGDGFTFLLVPQRSTFPDNANGSRLGLTGLWNSTEIRVVAVEFDLFPNKEIDPDYQHVGIDINNLSSVANTKWDTGDSILEGWEQEAWISYDSQSKTLSVRFSDFTNGSPNTKTLFHVVDLRSVCPEFVTFGLSASTGGGNGVIQKINSWSFSSKLGLTELWDSPEFGLVAVEFDLFPNKDIDPPYEHVGIDINNISSVANRRWYTGDSILEGRAQEAWINYDSESRNLTVLFTGFRNGLRVTQNLSFVVDLRQYCPEFVNFGFSASTGGGNTSIQNINSWSFSSNLQANMTQPNSPSGSGNSNTALIIGSAAGGAVIVAFGLLVFIFWMRRKRTINETDQIHDEFENGSISKKFKYNELKAATSNFSEQHKLGAGGFGSVYKGYLKASKLDVAVKRISSDSKQGIKEFVSEVKTISTLLHRNLVQLLGWCHEKKELLLVYEFLPNGSLDFHLFKGKSVLDWATRFRIVKGLASALLYLHEEWDQYVVHRDIKASNIMLDTNFNAKLGDFGLAKIVDHEIRSHTTFPAGTWGYMAPEYIISSRASKETDVFSFGVVVLEIATGQKSRHIDPDGNAQDLAERVWSLHRADKLIDAADPQLNSEFDLQEMEQLLGVGLWCAHPDRNLRPAIGEAIRVLKFEAQVPVLPVPVDLIPSPYQTDVSDTY